MNDSSKHLAFWECASCGAIANVRKQNGDCLRCDWPTHHLKRLVEKPTPVREHDTNNDADCWCEPQILLESGSKIYVHQNPEKTRSHPAKADGTPRQFETVEEFLKAKQEVEERSKNMKFEFGEDVWTLEKSLKQENQPSLRPLDEKALNTELERYFRNNLNGTLETPVRKSLVRYICYRFATPTITQMEIHEVIKNFLLDYNIHFKIGDMGTSGAGALLAAAISERLTKGDK